MNVFPSTSTMCEPWARAMNSGAAPTALNARTGLSTPRGRRDGRNGSSSCERAGGVAGVVRDDDVGAGASDGRQRFHDRARLVDPPVARGGFEHRVLAADVIGGRRIVKRVLHPGD